VALPLPLIHAFREPVNLEETARVLAELVAIAGTIGRPVSLGKLEISVTPVEPITAHLLEQYHALGVDRIILEPPSLTEVETVDQWVRGMAKLVLGGGAG
jgi:hypothetical protein